MNRDKLFEIVGGIDDSLIAESLRYDPEAAKTSPERIEHMKTKSLFSFLLAAALILSLGIAAYAISGIAHSVGTRVMSGTGEYASLSDLPMVEKLVSFPVRLTERFSDGYGFVKLHVDGQAAYDEEMNVLEEYRIVNAVYLSEAGHERYVSLSPVLHLPGAHEPPEPTERRMIGGTELRLSLDRYKLVPEDYVKSEEDLAAEEAGHFYITFGADEISERQFAFADFTIGEVNYTIMDMNGSAQTLDELARMAAELIAAAGSDR